MKRLLGITLLSSAFVFSTLGVARADDAPAAGGDAAKPAKAKKAKKSKKAEEKKDDAAAAPAPDAK